MSLERYRRARIIALNPRSSAYEAARAMADNHIGSVMIVQEGEVVGVVTDRDLALEIIANELDARSTPVRDLMAEVPITVDTGGSVEEVVRAMCEHGIRRVPLTEDGKPVGIVTLDDLLIDGVVDTATARAIIASQLEIGARFKPAGVSHPEAPARPIAPTPRTRALTRRKARADSAYARLLRAVEAHTGIQNRDQADLSLRIVLGGLCRRVTPSEAKHLIAQLPSKIQPDLLAHLDGPDRRITTEAIVNELARTLKVDGGMAHDVLTAVCNAVADCVSAGEVEVLRGQLPVSMKELFPATPLRKTA